MSMHFVFMKDTSRTPFQGEIGIRQPEFETGELVSVRRSRNLVGNYSDAKVTRRSVVWDKQRNRNHGEDMTLCMACYLLSCCMCCATQAADSAGEKYLYAVEYVNDGRSEFNVEVEYMRKLAFVVEQPTPTHTDMGAATSTSGSTGVSAAHAVLAAPLGEDVDVVVDADVDIVGSL